MLVFNYAFVGGNANSANNLASIDVVNTDGQDLLLIFAKFNGVAFPELASIRRPDGLLTTYSYDAAGNLIEVDRPGNPNAPTIAEQYSYANGGNAIDGDITNFTYVGSRPISSITQTANVNFTPNDTSTVQQALQYGLPSGMQNFITTTFSGIGSGTTHMNDSDGHARIWEYDQSQRVTQTSAWTERHWLVTSAALNLRTLSLPEPLHTGTRRITPTIRMAILSPLNFPWCKPRRATSV